MHGCCGRRHQKSPNTTVAEADVGPRVPRVENDKSWPKSSLMQRHARSEWGRYGDDSTDPDRGWCLCQFRWDGQDIGVTMVCSAASFLCRDLNLDLHFGLVQT